MILFKIRPLSQASKYVKRNSNQVRCKIKAKQNKGKQKLPLGKESPDQEPGSLLTLSPADCVTVGSEYLLLFACITLFSFGNCPPAPALLLTGVYPCHAGFLFYLPGHRGWLTEEYVAKPVQLRTSLRFCWNCQKSSTRFSQELGIERVMDSDSCLSLCFAAERHPTGRQSEKHPGRCRGGGYIWIPPSH